MLAKKKSTLELENLLRRANALSESHNIAGLQDLLRTIWRAYQAKVMLDPYLQNDHCAKQDVDLNFCSFKEKYDCYQGTAKEYISLKEPVITFPWHPLRIIRNLGTIGPNRPRGNFVPSSNHCVHFFWPIMLTKVTGGNHSIAQGILMGEGKVEVHDWFDLTPLLKKYRFDGKNWVNTENCKVITHCDPIELGWAWEVSRYLVPLCKPPFKNGKNCLKVQDEDTYV